MHRVKANKKVLIGLIISIFIVFLGGYMYWRNIYIPSQNAEAPTPIPTQSNNEIPFPTPIVISPIPTPEDIDSWITSSPNVNYQWTFKYPPSWREDAILKGWSYQPKDVFADEDYSLNFFEVKEDWVTPEQYVITGSVVGAGNTVIKYEVTTINGREVEIIINTEIKDDVVTRLQIQAFIKDVDFIDIINQGQCYEGGMLNISARYNNPPEFTINNIPYENDIKQMLTTFEITDCVPSN